MSNHKKPSCIAEGCYVKPINKKIGVLYFDRSKTTLEDVAASFNSIRFSNTFSYVLALPDVFSLESTTEEELEKWIETAQKVLKEKRGKLNEQS